MKPLISIITPSYNQGEFIEDNIKSVYNSRYDNIEHIVVDGGSTDQTISVLKQYEDQYNLRWVSETDRGQSHALNKGIEMADGEWIGWQNSDDYYLKDAFDRFVEAIGNSPQTDVVYGDVLIVDSQNNQIGKKFNIEPSKFIQRYWSVFANNQATLFSRNVFDSVGQINENLEYTMDTELMWRILDSDLHVTHIPQFLGAFRKHSQAKTIDSDRGVHPELESVYEYSRFEEVCPQTVLEIAAKCLKATYLIRDDRWEAIKHNLVK